MTWFIIGLIYILAAMGFLIEGFVSDLPLEGTSESLLYLFVALFMLFLSSIIMMGYRWSWFLSVVAWGVLGAYYVVQSLEYTYALIGIGLAAVAIYLHFMSPVLRWFQIRG